MFVAAHASAIAPMLQPAFAWDTVHAVALCGKNQVESSTAPDG